MSVNSELKATKIIGQMKAFSSCSIGIYQATYGQPMSTCQPRCYLIDNTIMGKHPFCLKASLL